MTRTSMLRRGLGALGLAGVVAGMAAAQPAPSGAHLVGGFTQLFISPCGEPYRGRPGDPYPVALWFKQADLNHDGVIDKAEFRADHAGFFDALDSNEDGVLDGTELGFYEHVVVPDVFGRLLPRLGALDPPSRDGARLIRVQGPSLSPGGINDSAGQMGAKGPMPGLNAKRPEEKVLEGAAAYGLLAEPEPVMAADTDLDGRITKAEFLEAADRRFKRLDKRGDGKLTLDELPMTASQAEAAEQARHKKR